MKGNRVIAGILLVGILASALTGCRNTDVNKEETETTINVLYDEKLISIYTNKIELQKQLKKVLGKPKREDIRGNSIIGSCWEVPFSEKTKISQMMLKANIFEL